MANARSSKTRADDADQSDVALLIDYENLQVSLKRHFNLTTPKMSLIIQEAAEYGRLVLSRAYAPWTSPDLAIDAENLYRQGIDLIYTPAAKNSADVRMAVDAVDLVQRRDNIGTIVFVTGDGDLIHPLNYLRQQGARIVVIGVDAAMSRLLASAADNVLIYERDLDPSVSRQAARAHQRETPNGKQPAPANESRPESPLGRLTPLRNAPSPEEAFKALRDVLQRHSDGEPMLFQEVGHWLGREHNMKPRQMYGVPFSVFMEAAQESGGVQLTTSGGNSYATLPQNGCDDLNDDTDDSDTDDETLTSRVRLESLQPEERTALFDALRDLEADPRLTYFTFRTILRNLLANSALPRLSDEQIRALLNDLVTRDPPILIRSQKRGRNASGGTYVFPAFSLTSNRELLDEPAAPASGVDASPTWDSDTVRIDT